MLIFGLLSSVVLSVLSAVTVPLSRSGMIDFDVAELLGDTGMVLAFLFVFFAVRSYRETVGGGVIGFRRGVAVGLLVTFVAGASYMVGWEIAYWGFFPDLADRHSAYVIERMRDHGEPAAAIAAAEVEMAELRRLYHNPAVNVGRSFLEVFPVGFVVTPGSAAALRRKTAPRPRDPLQPSEK